MTLHSCFQPASLTPYPAPLHWKQSQSQTVVHSVTDYNLILLPTDIGSCGGTGKYYVILIILLLIMRRSSITDPVTNLISESGAGHGQVGPIRSQSLTVVSDAARRPRPTQSK